MNNNLFANQIKASKLSFGGLKSNSSSVSQNSNKENQLSFQNLKRQVSLQFFPWPQNKQTSLSCSTSGYHYKKNMNMAKDSTNDTCSVKSVQRQKSLYLRRTNSQQKNKELQQRYKNSQQSIQMLIQEYNIKFNEIIEALTDMQIKDLMKFNGMMQKNTQIYQQWVPNNEFLPLFQSVNEKQLARIRQIQKFVHQIIISPLGSMEFRITMEQKSNLVSSILNEGSQSLIKNKKNHINQSKQSLEDTPQSLKSKLSGVSNRIKPQKKIEMFDKINVCQSIEEPVEIFPMSIKQTRSTQAKRQHRYNNYNDQNQ